MQDKLIRIEKPQNKVYVSDENKLRNEEQLLNKQKQKVPDHIIKELSNIVYKYQQQSNPQMIYRSSSNYQDLYKKDPESFQTQYSIQKYPGDIKEAKQKTKNMTINEIYLHKKNQILGWFNVDIYKEEYILQKYGLGVPLLFTQIKMIIIVLYILFFINLYPAIQQFNQCSDKTSCYSIITGGQGIIDIVNLPNLKFSSVSLLTWIVFSFFLKIYIKRICEQDDSLQSQENSQSYQIILKYFKKGLNQKEVEEILNVKLHEFSERLNIKQLEQVQLQVNEVILIQNHYEVNKKMKQINQIYMKIIKEIYNNHQTLLQTQKINQIDSFISDSIEEQNKVYFNQMQSKYLSPQKKIVEQINQPSPVNSNEKDNQQFQIETLQYSGIESNQNSIQTLSKQLNQIRKYNENRNEETTDTQYSSPKKLQFEIDDKQFKNQNIKANSQFKPNMKDEINNHLRDQNIFQKEKVQNESNNQNDFDFENQRQIQDNEEEENLKILANKRFQEQQSINKQDQSIQNEDDQNSLNSNNDDFDILNLKSKQILEQNDNQKTKKLLKLITHYHNEKKTLQDLLQPNNTQTSSYILRCQNFQQEEIIKYILKPRNQIVSFFQKCKYFFRKKNSDYNLNRTEQTKPSHLDIKWNTIGIDFKSKLTKQFCTSILGTLQFLFSFFIIASLYGFKMENEQEQSSFLTRLYKFLIAISQSLFYLINEKIFEVYSKHMVTSLKSQRICIQMNNFFFFYTLSYTIFPLCGALFISYSARESNQIYPFDIIGQSPFQTLVLNFLIACGVFSIKVTIYDFKFFQFYQSYKFCSLQYYFTQQYHYNQFNSINIIQYFDDRNFEKINILTLSFSIKKVIFPYKMDKYSIKTMVL